MKKQNRLAFFWILLLLISFQRLYAQRPNILFILADDMSYPYSSVYGDPVVKTPNLERLAQHGVTFTNAYSANPSCTPSRAGILTGRYPHKLGEAVNLVGRLDASIPTYVHSLRKEGYEVAFDRKGWGALVILLKWATRKTLPARKLSFRRCSVSCRKRSHSSFGLAPMIHTGPFRLEKEEFQALI